MKRTIITVILALLMCGSVLAQMPAHNDTKGSDLTARVPVDKKVIIGHLDNGFTYYIRDNRKPEDRIRFCLVSNAGSILERDDQQGLAHFCEHMAFNGIKGYPHNTMVKKLQEHGIEFGRGINAQTGFDETVYYVDLPASDSEMVAMGIDILDGWAGNILFDQAEIESERGVIHEEWRGDIGHGDRMRKKTLPVILKGSLYADRLPIGKEEVIMNFGRQSIVDFFNDWYRPDLQAIVIVGDLQGYEYGGKKGAKAMEQRVREVFGSHAKAVNPKPRPVFTIPSNNEPLIAIATDKEATSTAMAVTWKQPKAKTGTVGDYRESIVRSLVMMMVNDRLTEICEKSTAPMIYAYMEYNGLVGEVAREVDDVTISCLPKENRIDDAVTAMLTETRRMARHGFLSTELERQKEALLSSYAKSAKEENKTESDALAGEYTRNYLTGEVIPGIRQEWRYAKEFMPGITLEECNAMAASWITDSNIVFYLTAPDRDGYRIPDEAEVRRLIADSRISEPQPWVDTYEDKPLFSDEVAEASPTVVLRNEAVGYTEYRCPNGVRFVVKGTDLAADQILIGSQSFGGTSLYSDEECFLATMTADLVDACGLGEFTNNQLSKKLKGKNLWLSPYISGQEQGFMGYCSPQDLETTLQVVNLYYSAPRADKDIFDRTTEMLRTRVKTASDNPQMELSKTFHRTRYPDDRRTVIVPTEEQIASLQPESALKVFRERFHDASGQVFFFVGNVGDDDIALIARYLNHLPADGSQRDERYIDRSPRFAKGVVHAEAVKGIERQGMLCLHGEMNLPLGELTAERQIAVEALGAAIEITTLEIIREKNGDAYSPSAGIYSGLLPAPQVTWQFIIGCDPDKTAKIEKDCIKILKQYIKHGPDEKTLAKVKEQMIVNHGTQVQGNGFWLNHLMAAYSTGESIDYLARYDEIVRSLTAKQLRDLAKRYINLKNYAAVALRPEDTSNATAN